MYLVAIIRPGAQFQCASLVIKRKIGNINSARRAKLRRGWPKHVTVKFNHCTTRHVASCVVISTVFVLPQKIPQIKTEIL